jgi:hypothetical protein
MDIPNIANVVETPMDPNAKLEQNQAFNLQVQDGKKISWEMELSYTHLCRYLETNVANLSLAI